MIGVYIDEYNHGCDRVLVSVAGVESLRLSPDECRELADALDTYAEIARQRRVTRERERRGEGS